jgi:hypothetical protein
LLDYAKLTDSYILIHKIVIDEVRAKIKSRCLEAIEKIEENYKELGNWISIDPPILDKEKLIESAIKKFEGNFPQLEHSGWESCKIVYGNKMLIPIYAEDIDEAIKRSIERIPPCSKKGEELRDTIIWLNSLRFCRSIPNIDYQKINVDFISANFKEFADTDTKNKKKMLKAKLKEDIEVSGINLNYFESISDFLTEYLEPIKGIDRDWVLAHIDLNEIKKFIQERKLLQNFNYFNNLSQPVELTLKDWEIELDDFYLWKLEDNLEIDLIIAVNVRNDLIVKKGEEYASGIKFEFFSDLIEKNILFNKTKSYNIKWSQA